MAKVFKLFQKGIVLKPIDSGPNSSCCNPTDNIEGSFWILCNELRSYLGAAVRTFVCTGQAQTLTCKTLTSPIINCATVSGGTFTSIDIDDDQFTLSGSGDCTKKAQLCVDGITACTTRTLTVQDKNVTIASTVSETHTGCTNICSLTVCMNLIVTGNLTVNGCASCLCVTVLQVDDANILVNKGGNQAAANTQCAGITVTMSDATDVQLAYDSTLNSRFKIGDVASEAQVATVSHTQTLTNKTITAPTVTTGTFACPAISGAGTTIDCAAITDGSIGGTVNVDLTTGQLTLPNSTTACLPNAPVDEGELFYDTDEHKVVMRNNKPCMCAQGLQQLDGALVRFQVCQTAHGFALRDAIYFVDCTCEWQQAQANAAGTLAQYVVTDLISCNKFEATKFGRITFPCMHCLTIGSTYYNSICAAGAAVTPAPITGYVSPLFFVEDCFTLHFTVHQPILIGCGVAEDSEIGSIMAFGIPLACPPVGFVAADGQVLAKTGIYACLFAKIGSAYGSVGCNFNVPDLRGKFLRGQDNGAGIDPDACCRAISATGGNTNDNVGSIQGCAVDCHSHLDTFSNINCTSIPAFLTAGGASTGLVRTTTGCTSACVSASHAHTQGGAVTTVTGACLGETRPINVYVNYFIRYAAKGALLASCLRFVEDLIDTPSSYACQATKLVAVNSCADALEFICAPASCSEAAIPCLAIDWCAASFFYKEISCNSTFTFTNFCVTGGGVINVAVENTSTCARTITFTEPPCVSIVWAGGIAIDNIPGSAAPCPNPISMWSFIFTSGLQTCGVIIANGVENLT